MGVIEALPDKTTFEQISEACYVAVWIESISGRGYGVCKGTEAGVCLVVVRNSKENSVNGFRREGLRCGRGSDHVDPCRPLPGLWLLL